MNTLAELRRKLVPGCKFQLIYRSNARTGQILPEPREVIKVMSSQIVVINPNSPTAEEQRRKGKGSYLEFPTASLMDISEKGFIIYESGKRKMTPEEKKIWDGQPVDEKQSEIDIMTDGSTMFYRRQYYFKNAGMPHLLGYETGKPERMDYKDKDEEGYPFIISNKVKGEIALSYEFMTN